MDERLGNRATGQPGNRGVIWFFGKRVSRSSVTPVARLPGCPAARFPGNIYIAHFDRAPGLMLMAEMVSRSVREFADEVASGNPAPGGGSVSALAGSLGAALGCMVANLTLGKPGYESSAGEITDALQKLETLRKDILNIVEEDTQAFNRVSASYQLSKESGTQKLERSKAIQDSLKGATQVPLRLTRKCSSALDLMKTLAAKGNPSASSDAGVGALMLYAGLMGASLNVEINLGGMKDQDFAARTRKELEGNTAFAAEKLKDILATCRSRMA
jgi:formiminotetrahydrofolate cyclodeaminase